MKPAPNTQRPLFKCIKYFGLTILAMFLLVNASLADDLDDEVSIEDISHSDSIKPDISISYIIRNAKSDALLQSGRLSKSAGKGNKAVQGGAYFEVGTTVKGDVIVVFEGKKNINIAF